MHNFIIFFDEKSGTSPLVRLLDQFESISILHQENNSGYEPFDRHNCGHMRINDLRRCLDIIYQRGPKNIEKLNRIYTRTAKKRLETITGEGVVGLKMRFKPPRSHPFHIDRFPAWNEFSARKFGRRYVQYFKKTMFDVLRRHDVVVLLAVRQDVLRLGLSKYHGDGTGKPGHLQFKLARGIIDRGDIGKIQVDCRRLEEIIVNCEELHKNKKHLMHEFRSAGIKAHPIFYEDFVTDKRAYLGNLFSILDLDIPDDEILRVLSQEEYLKKVHSDDISEFVENHKEVLDRFGDRFVSWK